MSDAATATSTATLTSTSPPTAAKLFAKASEAEMKRVLDAVASRHGGNFYFKTKCGRTVVVVYSVEFVGKQWHFRVGAAIHTIQNLSKSGKLFSGPYKQATAPSKAALRVTACGRFLRRPLYLEVGRSKVEDTAASAVVCTDATASPIALFENRDAVRAVLETFASGSSLRLCLARRQFGERAPARVQALLPLTTPSERPRTARRLTAATWIPLMRCGLP
jgi:hypothetical protein